MARVKYYYDTETCKYERVKVKTSDIILNLLGFLTLSVLIAIGLTFLLGRYYKSDKEKVLLNENEKLKEFYSILSNRLDQVDGTLASLQKRDNNVYRLIFEANPIPTSVRVSGVKNDKAYEKILKSGLAKDKKSLITNTFKKVNQLKRKMYVQTKSYDEIIKMVKDKSKMLSHLPAIQPISNKQLTRLTSGFGMRMHPLYKVAHFHPGIDFAAPYNTPIYATADGVVKRSEYMGGYGNTVDIDHGYNYVTRYAHMASFKVKPGDKVKRGQCIGYVGSTGFSTAPHVHYEVLKNGKQIDPVYFFFNDLTPEEYEKILKLASIKNQSLS
ncbi:MAG TPA: peptidase M23 [Microscillaceae bacterium]|nr:peptidase M23 [Microscillaceae bacterium]